MKKSANGSHLEESFLAQLRTLGLPEPEREIRFHPVRKWRFDFGWPGQKLAVEIEGGTYAASRHTTGAGYAKDIEKYNYAVGMGWRVLRFDGPMVNSGAAVNFIDEILSGRF